jgi:hypothetical protein
MLMAEPTSVPHPLHTYLVDLQKSVRAVQQRLAGKMDRPANEFAAGNVWLGPTADAWGQQLSKHRTSYKAELARLEAVVRAKLATTPATCTAEESQTWKRRLYSA